MKNKLLPILIILLLSIIQVHADSFGCTVICEVPEEPINYTIPKVEGSGYFELSEGQIVYQTIEKVKGE